jgi:hypothetical protein
MFLQRVREMVARVSIDGYLMIDGSNVLDGEVNKAGKGEDQPGNPHSAIYHVWKCLGPGLEWRGIDSIDAMAYSYYTVDLQ